MAKPVKVVDVAIIGAGFAGVGVGIALKKKNINNFVIFEGDSSVGGAWRKNTYPGCGCDVPSHLYSYSFEPNPDWPEAYSKQKDIKSYIEHCTEKYQVGPHIRFNTRITHADFDEAKGVWRLTESDDSITEARVFVPAIGALSIPQYPNVKGRETFEGATSHAAAWDDTLDLTGKRVAVIGTGASAVQVVPNVAEDVAQLHVFQRTASWVIPKRNRVYTDEERQQWAKYPYKQRIERLKLYWTMETSIPALMWYPKLLEIGEAAHTKKLNRAITDPVLRKKLTPDYNLGCKRTLVSDDYFKTFARDNVHLITDDIVEITPKGIKTCDGAEHELDVIIFASGYAVGEPAYPFDISGLDGISLREYWGDQRKAYYGMAVSQFPNMLSIMGPNSGPGHTSVLVYQEAQYKYVAKYTQHLLSNELRYLNVKESVQEKQFISFQKRMKNSTWTSGCNSWYLNEDGTNSTMWPGFSFEFVLRTKRLNARAYEEV